MISNVREDRPSIADQQAARVKQSFDLVDVREIFVDIHYRWRRFERHRIQPVADPNTFQLLRYQDVFNLHLRRRRSAGRTLQPAGTTWPANGIPRALTEPDLPYVRR